MALSSFVNNAMAFRGAENNRLLAHLPTISQDPYDEIDNGVLCRLRRRCRWLCGNSTAAAGLSTIKNRVSGGGIKFLPEPLDNEWRPLRDEARELRAEWRKYRKQISTHGKKSHEFFNHLVQTYIREGEVFALKVDDQDARIGRRWQILEGDQVAENVTKESLSVAPGNFVRLGVEMTPNGEPVAVHFFDDGYDVWFGNVGRKTRRITMDRLLHWQNGNRFGSPRGIPLFSGVIMLIANQEEWVEAALTQAWVQTCLAVFIYSDQMDIAQEVMAGKTNDEVFDSLTDTTRNDRLENAKLQPGMIKILDRGSNVVMNEPKSPPSTFSDFDKAILKSIASNIGISYVGLTRDVAESSYSGARQAENYDQFTYQNLQSLFGENVLEPMYEEFIEYLYNVHRYRVAPPEANDLKSVQIIYPTMREIDPLKEQKAFDVQLTNETASPQDIAAKQGKDYYGTQDQIEEANRYKLERKVRTLPDIERAVIAALETAQRVNQVYPEAAVSWRDFLDTGLSAAPVAAMIDDEPDNQEDEEQ